jgi:hypothetical protein
MLIKPGKYKHYKGNFYEVLFTAKDSENLEPMVVYRALYGDGDIWVRPLQMFQETVTVQSISMPRFLFVG